MNRGSAKSKSCAQSDIRGGSFRITKKTDYALFLLVALAETQSARSLRPLALAHGMSFYFLQKIALMLRKKRLIQAERGNTGGYRLARSPERIFFRDILTAVEGTVLVSGCLASDSRVRISCPRRGLCTIRPALKKIQKDMQNLYLSKPLTYFMGRV